jgi:DnaJ-class molecular chaperone
MTDAYSVLGVPPTATQAQITHAYRSQLRDHHPDLQAPQSDSGADERLREILAAYALLRDPVRRAAYDRAQRANTDTGPIRVKVTRAHSTGDEPPLRAGPVRWHR